MVILLIDLPVFRRREEKGVLNAMRINTFLISTLIISISTAGITRAEIQGIPVTTHIQPISTKFPECIYNDSTDSPILKPFENFPLVYCKSGVVHIDGGAIEPAGDDHSGLMPESAPVVDGEFPDSIKINDRIELDNDLQAVATDDGILIYGPDGKLKERIIGGPGALPWPEVKALALDFEGRLLAGTTKGLARQKPQGGWEWYSGKRYLPGDSVIDVYADGRRVWIMTDGGLGMIDFQEWTLEQKAFYLEKMTQERHNREGLVASDLLADPNDLTSVVPRSNDNDGLWTSMYIAAEAYRFALTGDPEAKKLARSSLEALMRLESITGIPGFPARSFAPLDGSVVLKDGEWHISEVEPGYQWKGDTSSDEIVGHYYAYSVYYDFVADDREKEEIGQVVARITDHIIDNDYFLVDLDGKPTYWGRWNPDFFKSSGLGFSLHRINSLEILSHLLTAYHITGDKKYFEHYRHLIDEHKYDRNTVNQRWKIKGAINHSADELAFLSYYPLLKYAKKYETDKSTLGKFKKSLKNTWEEERPEENPLWSYIVCSLTGGRLPCDLDIAVETLKEMPVDQRYWSIVNSYRKDIVQSIYKDRLEGLQGEKVVRPGERCPCKWNFNPYNLDSDGDGTHEESGTPFLLPYWMGRYYGYIDES